MNKLTTIQPQESFPTVDLSDQNADTLELLLQREESFENIVTEAKQANMLMRRGHDILLIACKQHLLRHELEMVSNGVETYISISSLVAPTVRPYRNSVSLSPHLEMALLAVDENFTQVTDNLPELYRNHRPNTSRVVEARARRTHGNNVDYAVTGAALAYRLDMRAAAAAEGEEW